MYITICKGDSQWEFALWLRELKQGLCNNLEGWDEEADGSEFQEGGNICIPMADSCQFLALTTKFCKAIILQLKNKYIKKNSRNTALHISRQAAQSHTKSTDIPKLNIGYGSAFQRDEIQLHPQAQVPQPGNLHEALFQLHTLEADSKIKSYNLPVCRKGTPSKVN